MMTSMLELYNYTKNLSLLYVEDEPTLLLQMKEIFLELFKSVETTTNGKLGLHAFKKRLKQGKKSYDLVITDINMPIMNGIEMVKEIYSIAPHQPIIITSAHCDTEYLIPLLNMGVNGFLIKPLDITTMTDSLFTTSKFIVNEQLIKKHYKEIKSLNKQLAKKTLALELSNEELSSKTIAIEQSLRIIEGMYHKHQINNKIISIDMPLKSKKKHKVFHKQDSTTNQCLKKIEFIICDVSMKYHLDGIRNELLIDLSAEIARYSELLINNQKYTHLKDSLKLLSDTVAQRPRCTKDKELSRIFTMLESFFYIYVKWQNEWPNIDDKNFLFSSQSIEHDIEVLISLWTCKM